jgi:hypothetical protein
MPSSFGSNPPNKGNAMDRRMAVGMLGAATLGALATREARADDTDTNPMAARLNGRRVVIYSDHFNIQATVESSNGTLLWLRDVATTEGPSAKEAVVDISACKLIMLADEDRK